jgi:hypothetical protein
MEKKERETLSDYAHELARDCAHHASRTSDSLCFPPAPGQAPLLSAQLTCRKAAQVLALCEILNDYDQKTQPCTP